MKPVIFILWAQLVVGLIGSCVSFAYMHQGAIGVAWCRSFKSDLDKVRQSPEYREPPLIKGDSYGLIVEKLEWGWRARAKLAFASLGLCAGLVASSILLLWLLRRVRHPMDCEQEAD